MAESLSIQADSKAAIYQQLLPQVKALCEHEPNLTANLANVCAALKQVFGFFWVGFYLVENENLVLGPFQGPIACTRIGYGKGVCGTAWKENRALLVPNVEEFPGHIACSSESKSEVVIPIQKNKEVVAVLDVDSDRLNDFDNDDLTHLSELCDWLGNSCF
jgi:GAF domain-containing protein